MDCPECQDREDREKRKRAIVEEYNKGIVLLHEAQDKLVDAYKGFDKLCENPDLGLHPVVSENPHVDSNFSMEDFVNDLSKEVSSLALVKLDILIYEHELEEL